MKTKVGILEPIIFCFVPILITALLYAKLPEMVAVHFNFEFEPDDYAPKWMLFIISGFCLCIETILCLSIKYKKLGMAQNPKILRIFLWIIPILSCIMEFSILAYALNNTTTFVRFIPFIVGIGFVLLGNLMPKVKPNYFLGIRLPWTLKNRENWRKTHKLFGKLLFALGIVLIIASFINISGTVLLTCIFLTVVIPCAYSYRLSRSEKD